MGFSNVEFCTEWLWPQPLPKGVGAVATTRFGGVSLSPYASMNLSDAVGDSAHSVAINRARLTQAIGVKPIYLKQVHGKQVVHLDETALLEPVSALRVADACITKERGLACVVLTADCLPVLFASSDGQVVAAAHAGWRGLAAGILEATLAAVVDLAHCQPAEIWTWLGPCIGPQEFEVGAEVLAAFMCSPKERNAAILQACFQPMGEKWRANLAALARYKLASAGVKLVHGGQWKTADAAFFSFRRDAGLTGRMATAIWLTD